MQNVLPTEAGISTARNRAIETFRGLSLHEQDLFAVELSLQEALVNALVHGVNQSHASHIWLSYELDEQRLRITVEDDGSDQNHRAGEHGGAGLGLTLIHSLMSYVKISALGHRICMELDRTQAGAQVASESCR